MEPYQALANAIVELAANDYKTALKYHYRHPDKQEYTDKVSHLERFFRSGWYGMLTNLDGEVLMDGIRKIARQEVAA